MYKKAADFLRTGNRSPNCSVFARGKKAISPVVALALLLVVSVTAVVSFQTWYSDFSSQVFSETEDNSQQTTTKIERVVNDNLYFKIGFSELEISQVNVEGNSCAISGNYTRGVEKLALGNNCTQNLSTTTPQIVVETNRGLYSHQFFKVNTESLSTTPQNQTNNQSTNCSITLTTSDTQGLGYSPLSISNHTVYVSNPDGSDYAASTSLSSTFDVNWTGTRVISVEDVNGRDGAWSVSLVDINANRTAQLFHLNNWITSLGHVGASTAGGMDAMPGNISSDRASFGINGDTGALKLYLDGQEVSPDPTYASNYSNWFNNTSVAIVPVINTNNGVAENFTLSIDSSNLPAHTGDVYDWCGNPLN